MQRLAGLANALFAGAEAAKVFDSLGDKVRIEFHCDAARRLATNGDVEEDTRTGLVVVRFGGHDGRLLQARVTVRRENRGMRRVECWTGHTVQGMKTWFS